LVLFFKKELLSDFSAVPLRTRKRFVPVMATGGGIFHCVSHGNPAPLSGVTAARKG
jgi:hypothetical protein